MARRFDLIVFDWDGTLMDSTDLIAVSLQRACADLGLAIPSAEAARHIIGMGLREALAHAVPDLAPGDTEALTARYRYHFLREDEDLPLFPGIRELLADLEGAGHLLAVATGKSRRGLTRAMATSGLQTCFHATRCADESRPKPDPTMLYEVMAMTGADPGRTLMIGDTSHDLLMARHAGVDAVAVSYGAHSREALATFPSLALVDDVPQLRQWFRGQGG